MFAIIFGSLLFVAGLFQVIRKQSVPITQTGTEIADRQQTSLLIWAVTGFFGLAIMLAGIYVESGTMGRFIVVGIALVLAGLGFARYDNPVKNVFFGLGLGCCVMYPLLHVLDTLF